MSIKHKHTCGPYKFLVINVFHVFCPSVAPVIPQQLQLVVIHFLKSFRVSALMSHMVTTYNTCFGLNIEYNIAQSL